MAPIVLTACQPAVLDPQGPVGLAQRMILIDSLAIMLAIVIPTIAATFAVAW
jgi:cytochrome o ubiquinol oxidase subunit 2